MKESNYFVNQYEYNREIVKEAINSWWNKKFQKVYCIIMMVPVILLFVLFFMTKEVKWLYLLSLPLLPIILLFLKKKIAIKTELKRISVIYKGETPKVKIIVDKEINMITSQGERSIEFSSIESFVETKKLIVLIIKGSMTIAVSKTGFTEGPYEEFLLYLNKVIRK